MNSRFVASILAATVLVTALAASADPRSREFVPASDAKVIHGGGVGAAKAGTDTFLLMGPTGSGAPYFGDFEEPGGSFDTDVYGWTSVDLSVPTLNRWHVSDYQAVSGSLSAWCGDPDIPSCGAPDPAGGYGPGWNELLEFRAAVANPALSTFLTITATANIDSEAGYDGTTLQAEKADQGFVDINHWEGQHAALPMSDNVTYLPGEYVGAGADEVVLLWRFTSDSAFDDEDCSYPSAGGIQLDDVTVLSDNGAGTGGLVDFEDGTLGPLQTRAPQGVGDFAAIWRFLETAGNPCETNWTQQVAFIDDGRVVPGTGGSRCINWCYGPEGYIVNTTGGLAGPTAHLHNAVLSPVMAWPDPTHRGAQLTFTVYRHEDLSADAPGMFYVWDVRSSTDPDPAAIEEASWENRNFQDGGGPDYHRQSEVLDDLLVSGPQHVQVRLAVQELGWIWGWIGDDGYPAPYFDNVRFETYPATGPRMATREVSLAQDGFPASGIVDMAFPEALSVRFDMGQNISPASHARRDFGDTVVFDCVPARPGGTLDGLPQLVYQVRTNPVFDPWRSEPTPYTGAVDCPEVICPSCVLEGRYAGDLPDENWLFPGDVVHYYFRATSVDSNAANPETSILPADTTGFSDFDDPLAYDPSFTMHCLPTIHDLAGTQAPTIFWNDFGDRGGREEWYGAFKYEDMVAGRDFDIYYTNSPTSGLGNGLGGKATSQQLAGYDVLLYTSGDLSWYTISNGDLTGDSGQDVQTLSTWLDTGEKGAFLTGDGLAADLYGSGLQTRAFLENYLQVNFLNGDLRNLIDGQMAPRVLPDPPDFTNPVFASLTSWIAYGGCPQVNTFDALEAINGPGTGAGVAIAKFGAAAGDSVYNAYAAATLATGVGSAETSQVISMPYDFSFIRTDPQEAGKDPATAPARARILGDVMVRFGFGNPFQPSAALPAAPRFATRHYPNPFNPQVRIDCTVVRPGRLTVKVYDLRGRRVRRLLDEHVAAGTALNWDGTDDRGAAVASGVYFYEARMHNEVRIGKLTLVR